MIQKLIIDCDSIENLKNEVDSGAKFVIFQYTISLFFAITLRRFSPAILIKNDDTKKKYQQKYNRYSYIFGWWGIPWGPIYTLKSINLNKKGGIDATEDIMLNIDERSLIAKEVELKVSNQLFCKPDKWDLKAYKKTLLKSFEYDYNVKQLVVGLFINTDEGIAPYRTIGLLVEKDFEKYNDKLFESLSTQFRKDTYFEMLNLSDNNETNKLFCKQAETLINRI